MKKQKLKNKYSIELEIKIVHEFLYHIFFVKKLSVRTRDTYLNFIRELGNFRLNYNAQKHSHNKKNSVLIKEEDIIRLFSYLENENRHFLLACYFMYYCFMTHRDVSFIKIKHINFDNCTIAPCLENIENRNDVVLIHFPKIIYDLLLELKIDKCPSENYLFGNDFKNAKQWQDGNQFNKYFLKIRTILEFPSNYRIYRLKDSGISEMLKQMP